MDSTLYLFIASIRLKHGIGADLSCSCYIYATEELCHKGTLYKMYAERHCEILFARKFQAANIARFGDMVYNVLPKWPFISIMQSHFENHIIKSPNYSGFLLKY